MLLMGRRISSGVIVVLSNKVVAMCISGVGTAWSMLGTKVLPSR